MIIYKWTDGNDEDFQRFYLKTEEYYSSIVGGIENRKGFIPYNISESITEVLIAYIDDTAVIFDAVIPVGYRVTEILLIKGGCYSFNCFLIGLEYVVHT